MSTQQMVPIGAGASASSFDGIYSGVVNAAADGSITIDTRDIPSAVAAGWLPATPHLRETTISAPTAAAATGIVANVTTANGALTIAAQPAAMRQLSIVTAPGSPGITAGTLALTYAANDGTTQVDNFSLIGAATATFVSSKACVHLTSAVISGLVGGTSPTIQIGTNAVLGVPIGAGSVGAALTREALDGTDQIGTNAGVLTNTGLYTPHTAPNGTHNYLVDYTTVHP